jgi:hypothetical protein
MCDIALGIQEMGLEIFAANVNASWMGQWKDLGLFDEGEESWQRAFEQALNKTLAAGGRFHFNLTGLDIPAALTGDPNWWVDATRPGSFSRLFAMPFGFAIPFFTATGRCFLPKRRRN